MSRNIITVQNDHATMNMFVNQQVFTAAQSYNYPYILIQNVLYTPLTQSETKSSVVQRY